ncbi:MAG: cytidine deaminase [Actinomycetota bacterium]
MTEVSQDELDGLVRAAHDARSRAYAPYSEFTVGAAVLAGGTVYSGCNVENASYGLSICAERVAATTAVAVGERRIDAVAVVGSGDRPTPPCGACRQFLNEFGPAMPVAAETPDGRREVWRLDNLLPHAFGPDFLSG